MNSNIKRYSSPGKFTFILFFTLAVMFLPVIAQPLSEAQKHNASGRQDSTKTTEERKAILDHLMDFYKLHIERLQDINAHEILREVWG